MRDIDFGLYANRLMEDFNRKRMEHPKRYDGATLRALRAARGVGRPAMSLTECFATLEQVK